MHGCMIVIEQWIKWWVHISTSSTIISSKLASYMVCYQWGTYEEYSPWYSHLLVILVGDLVGVVVGEVLVDPPPDSGTKTIF